MSRDDPSKTEDATPKRVRKQRQEGNVPKGQEITKAIVLLAGVLALRFLITLYHDEFREIFTWAFREAIFINNVDKSTAYSLFVWGIKKIALLVLPFMLIIVFASWLTMRLQVGSLWTTKVMQPKFGKLFNIMAGVKKLMISPQAFVNLAKSLGMAIAVGLAPYIVIKQEIPNLLPLFYATPYGIASYIITVGYKMVTYALIPMLLIALADLWYTRWSYNDKIKMTKEEVKDERKQAEGDPQIKAQQQAKMMEVMARRMMQDVPKADVVITNPTHYAIALRYDAMVAPAPMVLAKGVNRVAQRIKEIAREHDVPIERNPPLARALYKQVEIGETIPEDMFQAVAAILAKLDKFKSR